MSDANIQTSRRTTEELEELQRKIALELANRKRDEEMVPAYLVDNFGSRSVYKKLDDAVNELVEYIKDQDEDFWGTPPRVEGEAPYVGLKMILVPKSDYDKERDWWLA